MFHLQNMPVLVDDMDEESFWGLLYHSVHSEYIHFFQLHSSYNWHMSSMHFISWGKVFGLVLLVSKGIEFTPKL